MTPSRKKNRLESFLYQEGYFFVTINVQDRKRVFGEIVDEKMILNQYGKIVEDCWRDLPNHYANCWLADFVIMPNHFHAIISVEKISVCDVGEGFKPSLTPGHGLFEIIRWFKTFSSRKIHASWFSDFQRQRSFYDHVIRNDKDMERIQEYIWLNPYERENDEYYK